MSDDQARGGPVHRCRRLGVEFLRALPLVSLVLGREELCERDQLPYSFLG